MRCLVPEFNFPDLPLSCPKVWLLTAQHSPKVLPRLMKPLVVVKAGVALFVSDPCVFALCMCIFSYHELKPPKTRPDVRRVLYDAHASRNITQDWAFLSQFNWGEFHVLCQGKYKCVHWGVSLLAHLTLYYLPHQRGIAPNNATILRLAYDQSVGHLVALCVEAFGWETVLCCSV